jgi:hypothetical protein
MGGGFGGGKDRYGRRVWCGVVAKGWGNCGGKRVSRCGWGKEGEIGDEGQTQERWGSCSEGGDACGLFVNAATQK